MLFRHALQNVQVNKAQKNTFENKMQNFDNTKKAAFDIARAFTAKLWYKVLRTFKE